LGVQLIREHSLRSGETRSDAPASRPRFRAGGRRVRGPTATIVDDRFDYGETRFISAGHLDGRLVVMVWTQRGEARHIISMRHCHAKEEEIWRRRMG
jgi:uncharacterized DUF497 family protein